MGTKRLIKRLQRLYNKISYKNNSNKNNHIINPIKKLIKSIDKYTFDPLSPKGERFLIHSSQLKGSSNRLLPANPSASLERHGYVNEEGGLNTRAIHPRAKAQGFLAKKDKKSYE